MPRSTLDALAASGLLGKPLEPAALQRELVERLFIADGSLTFCWLQHPMPLRRLLSAAATAEAPAAAELQHRWLEPVASSRALAAVAFAHLRRRGPPLGQECQQLRRNAYCLIDESSRDGSWNNPELQQGHLPNLGRVNNGRGQPLSIYPQRLHPFFPCKDQG